MWYESLLRSIIFALIYGAMENRFFFEGHDDPWFLGHFTSYHLFMCLAFAVVSFDVNWKLWVWCMFAMPLIQDSFWQLLEGRKLRQDDWSNLGGFPLVNGKIYVWYCLDVFFLIVFPILTWGM
jgi:hypothetical protein